MKRPALQKAGRRFTDGSSDPKRFRDFQEMDPRALALRQSEWMNKKVILLRWKTMNTMKILTKKSSKLLA